MRKSVAVFGLLALSLTGCGGGNEKTTIPTSFAEQPKVSAGGVGAAGADPAANSKQKAGSAKIQD